MSVTTIVSEWSTELPSEPGTYLCLFEDPDAPGSFIVDVVKVFQRDRGKGLLGRSFMVLEMDVALRRGTPLGKLVWVVERPPLDAQFWWSRLAPVPPAGVGDPKADAP